MGRMANIFCHLVDRVENGKRTENYKYVYTPNTNDKRRKTRAKPNKNDG